MIAYPARVLLRLAALILVLGSWYPMPSRAADAPAAPPTVTVTVSQPIQRELVEWDEYTGQFAAKEYVEIRARVSGYLTEIHFEDGQIVKQGDLLFVIDPRPYEATLAAAQAQLAQANAQLGRLVDLRLLLEQDRDALGPGRAATARPPSTQRQVARLPAPKCASRSAPPSFSACSASPGSASSSLRCSTSSCAGCSASAGSRRASVLRSQLKAPSSFYGASLSLEGLHHDSVPRLLPCFFCLLMGGRSASSTGEAMRPDPTSSGTDRFRRESIVETA